MGEKVWYGGSFHQIGGTGGNNNGDGGASSIKVGPDGMISEGDLYLSSDNFLSAVSPSMILVNGKPVHAVLNGGEGGTELFSCKDILLYHVNGTISFISIDGVNWIAIRVPASDWQVWFKGSLYRGRNSPSEYYVSDDWLSWYSPASIANQITAATNGEKIFLVISSYAGLQVSSNGSSYSKVSFGIAGASNVLTDVDAAGAAIVVVGASTAGGAKNVVYSDDGGITWDALPFNHPFGYARVLGNISIGGGRGYKALRRLGIWDVMPSYGLTKAIREGNRIYSYPVLMSSVDNFESETAIGMMHGSWKGKLFIRDGEVVTFRSSGTTTNSVFCLESIDGDIDRLGVHPTGGHMTSATNGAFAAHCKADGACAVVARGGSGSRISSDLDSWASGSPANNYWTDLIYGGGIWVVVGWNGSTTGYIATSSNGTAWTARSISGTSVGLKAIAYDGSRFIAVGSNGIVSSTNGTSWSSTIGAAYSGAAIIYHDGNWVIAGSSQLLASTDGITFTPLNINTPGNGISIDYLQDSDLYILVTSSREVYVSSDLLATSWTKKTSIPSTAPLNTNSIGHNVIEYDGKWISSTGAFSDDEGATWQMTFPPSLIDSNGKLFSSPGDGKIYSHDSLESEGVLIRDLGSAGSLKTIRGGL